MASPPLAPQLQSPASPPLVYRLSTSSLPPVPRLCPTYPPLVSPGSPREVDQRGNSRGLAEGQAGNSELEKITFPGLCLAALFCETTVYLIKGIASLEKGGNN